MCDYWCFIFFCGRRAAVNTFGYIAKATGPADVLATLLNNLKVVPYFRVLFVVT